MIIFGYEFTCTKAKKKRKQPVKGYSSRRWNTQDTNFILELSNDGLTAKEISEQLRDRTPAGISARLWKVRKKD